MVLYVLCSVIYIYYNEPAILLGRILLSTRRVYAVTWPGIRHSALDSAPIYFAQERAPRTDSPERPILRNLHPPDVRRPAPAALVGSHRIRISCYLLLRARVARRRLFARVRR